MMAGGWSLTRYQRPRFINVQQSIAMRRAPKLLRKRQVLAWRWLFGSAQGVAGALRRLDGDPPCSACCFCDSDWKRQESLIGGIQTAARCIHRLPIAIDSNSV